jgi:putative ABC transport system ATP-binding protein
MILQAKNVSKWFDVGGVRTDILKDANLTLDFGEMLYIVGPSGSGNTTLLSIISGLLPPNKGSVVFKDKVLWELNDTALADFRLNSVGFVFQDFHLFPRLTAEENVAIPLILQKQPWNVAITEARKSLGLVGLKKKIAVIPNKLSIGEQQRVAIARAMITRPQLLIFDEPTASLDSNSGMKIISFIKKQLLSDKQAIIVVTHDHRIYDFATRIVHLEDGKILEGGSG